MEEIDDLARLEEAVQKLVSALQKTGEDKVQMELQLKSKDQEIAELKEKLLGLQDERSQVHQRVTGLISSIDQLERQVSRPAELPSDAGAVEGKTLF